MLNAQILDEKRPCTKVEMPSCYGPDQLVYKYRDLYIELVTASILLPKTSRPMFLNR
jgi:hypothetical protein